MKIPNTWPLFLIVPSFIMVSVNWCTLNSGNVRIVASVLCVIGLIGILRQNKVIRRLGKSAIQLGR